MPSSGWSKTALWGGFAARPANSSASSRRRRIRVIFIFDHITKEAAGRTEGRRKLKKRK